MIIKNKLIKEKGYTPEEASQIAHMIFENVWLDKVYGNRPAEFFYDAIVDAATYQTMTK
jgi:hypothetical protein